MELCSCILATSARCELVADAGLTRQLTCWHRFNIGISSIKLARYHDAGRYILDAIRLQHATASEGFSSPQGAAVKGVTSDVLWQSLRTACMQ